MNIISKKPMATPSTTVDVKGVTYSGDKLKFGDRSGYDVAADTTGAIDADPRFLYRMVAEYGDRDLFRDFMYEKSLYFAPSATWNISDVTWLTLQFEHRDVKSSFDNGLAAHLKFGNLFDKTYYESTGQTAQVQLAPGAPRNVTLSMRVNF